eukprot:scaffold24582_cov19-Tisochrysis_lutea.AAC.1
MGIRRLWASSGPLFRPIAIVSGVLMAAAAVNGLTSAFCHTRHTNKEEGYTFAQVDATWNHEHYEERRQEERDQLRCKGIMELLPERSQWQKMVAQSR